MKQDKIYQIGVKVFEMAVVQTRAVCPNNVKIINIIEIQIKRGALQKRLKQQVEHEALINDVKEGKYSEKQYKKCFDEKEMCSYGETEQVK